MIGVELESADEDVLAMVEEGRVIGAELESPGEDVVAMVELGGTLDVELSTAEEDVGEEDGGAVVDVMLGQT